MAQTAEKPTPDLDYYRRVLAGERVGLTADNPRHGYYRYMRSAVAIYPGALGDTIVEVDGVVQEGAERIEAVWVGCAGKPIEPEIFKKRIATGRWPEEDALISKSHSLAQNLKEMAELAKGYIKKLKDREKKLSPGEMIIDSQLEADRAAGYVQQIRAMKNESDETIKLQIAPLKEREKEIKAVWVDPVASLDEASDYLLSALTAFGKDQRAKSNNPEAFKFAAGRAGEGKTIGLRSTKRLEIDDYAALMRMFKEDPKVKEAIQEALRKAAEAKWKAEKKAPKGTREVLDFSAA